MNLNTGYDRFLDMPIFELLDMCEDYKELQKSIEKKVKRK